MPDDVEVPRAFRVFRFVWQLERCIGQQLMIAMRDAAAFAGPSRKVLEFYSQNSALDAFHAIVIADLVVVIALSRAVLAERASPSCESRVVGHQRATFAVGAQVLAWIKAEARHGAKGSDHFTFVLSSVGLSSVFNKSEIVLTANRQKRIQIDGMAVQMDWHDCFGARSDCTLDELRVEVEGLVVDVDINGLCARVRNGPTGGYESGWGSDDLITRADVEQEQSYMESGGAAVEPDTMLCLAKTRKIFFKLDYVRPEAKGAVIERARDRGVDFLAQWPHLGRQIEIRHGGESLGMSCHCLLRLIETDEANNREKP